MGVRKTLRNVVHNLAALAKDASATTFTYRLDDPRLKKIFNRDDDSSLTDPYSQLSTFYACVNAKCAIAQVPFLIYRAGTDVVIEKGGIIDLFKNPNPAISRFQLWEAIVIPLENKGEWFIVKDRETGTDGVPAFLWPINPSMMTPARMGQGGPWVGWWIQRNGRREFLAREEVLFDKYLNPNDEIRGLAPMSAARLSAESSYDALRYNRNFFKNDATPPLVYLWKDYLTDEQYRQEKERLIDSRKGVQNAHRAALIDGGADIKQLGLSQRDMEFIQQFKLTRDDICMIERTPKSMIAINEDVNYANAMSSKRGFWTDVLIPLMVRIEDKINGELLLPLGYEGHFDLQKVDALNWAWLEKVDNAVKLVNIGFPLNRVNERLQLGFEDVEGGDEPRQVAAPALPAPQPVKAIEADFVAGRVLQLTSDAEEKGARARAWEEIDRKSSSLVSKCNREIRGYFQSAEAKLFKKLIKRAAGAVMKMGEVDPGMLSEVFSDEELGRIITKWTSLSLEAGAGTIVASTFDLTDPQVLSAVQRHTSKVVEINENVRQQLQDTIRATTEQAVAEGMTEQQTADLLVANVKEKLTQFDHHARTIARTEVHGAYSEGRYEGMKTTFPKAKKWISSRDTKVRDSHAHLDGKVVPWEEAFANGLQYPLDPAGDASEVINCRCIMVPVYEGEDIKAMESSEPGPQEMLQALKDISAKLAARPKRRVIDIVHSDDGSHSQVTIEGDEE